MSQSNETVIKSDSKISMIQIPSIRKLFTIKPYLFFILIGASFFILELIVGYLFSVIYPRPTSSIDSKFETWLRTYHIISTIKNFCVNVGSIAIMWGLLMGVTSDGTLKDQVKFVLLSFFIIFFIILLFRSSFNSLLT